MRSQKIINSHLGVRATKDAFFEKKSINQNWNFQTDVWVKGGGGGGGQKMPGYDTF